MSQVVTFGYPLYYEEVLMRGNLEKHEMAQEFSSLTSMHMK